VKKYYIIYIYIYIYIIFLHSMLWLLVTANVVPSSSILVTLMMEVIRSSETLILTRAMQCNIPEDGIIRSHVCENLKSYMTMKEFINVSLFQFICTSFNSTCKGHTIPQVDSHWLPTVAVQAWSQLRSYEICGAQSGAGAVFQVLDFPCKLSFHHLLNTY
jgi:hypothetical protein